MIYLMKFLRGVELFVSNVAGNGLGLRSVYNVWMAVWLSFLHFRPQGLEKLRAVVLYLIIYIYFFFTILCQLLATIQRTSVYFPILPLP